MIPVTLSKDLARSIRGGHPWIFRAALRPAPPIPDGSLVQVRGRGGRPLAVGFWDADSPIAVRILSTGPAPDVDARLRAALDARRRRLDPARTTAFRWAHGEADGLPGLHLDLYDDVAVARFDGSGARAFYRDLGPRLHRIVPLRSGIDRLSGRLLHGAAPGTFTVLENGLKFEVCPAGAGKGGLFLDQRENRGEIERRARGRRVLNLFGFTGGFSLYAARGGAASTDTVEIARPALAGARRNFELNGLGAASFHAADAFKYLEKAVTDRRRWDLVVSDPPSFAPRQSALPAARKAYAALHRLACSVLEPGGILLACSCSSHVTREEFRRTIEAGARAAGRRFLIEEWRGAGFDHPVADFFPEGDYLKAALGRVV